MMKRYFGVSLILLSLICLAVSPGRAFATEGSIPPKEWVARFESLLRRQVDIGEWKIHAESRPSAQREGDWFHATYEGRVIQATLGGYAQDACHFATVIFFPESEANTNPQAALADFLSCCAASITASVSGDDRTWDAAFSMIKSAMADFAADNSQLTQYLTFEGLGITLQHGLSGEPYHGMLIDMGEADTWQTSSQTEAFALRLRSIYAHYNFDFPQHITSSSADQLQFALPNDIYGSLAVQNEEIRAVYLFVSYEGMDSAARDACAQALYDQAMIALSAASNVPAFETNLIRAQLHALGNGFADGVEKRWELTEWSLLLTPMPDESLYFITIFRR